MSKYVLEKDKEKGYLLNGNPITENDILMLLSSFAVRNKDEDLERVIDYWIMLKESGHNGFYLKSYHQVTKNQSEAIRK